MTVNILNLPHFTVKAVNETDHDYRIAAEVAVKPGWCLNCNGTEIVGFGRHKELIMDTPMHGKRVGIVVDRRRYRCSECNTTFYEIVPGKDAKRHATKRLVTYIEQNSLRHTFAHISDEVGIDEKTVRNIFRDFVEREELALDFVTPRYLGIDEIHVIRKPRCVITNIEEQTILNMLPSRTKPVVTKFLHDMKDRHTVEFVAMDMWNPYKDAVRGCLPNATIVIDKFHVVRMANDAMERARKSVRAGLTTKQRRGLMRDRHVLLRRKSEMTMTEQIAFDSWTMNYPAIGEAYEFKEAFYGIWDNATTRHEAETFYSRWLACMTPELATHFGPLLTAMTNWREEIFAYFDHPITNAYTESLNNLIRFMNRAGRGYSYEALRAKILFTQGIHKRRRPSYNRDPNQWDMGRSVAFLKPTIFNYGTSISTLVKQLQEQESES